MALALSPLTSVYSNVLHFSFMLAEDDKVLQFRSNLAWGWAERWVEIYSNSVPHIARISSIDSSILHHFFHQPGLLPSGALVFNKVPRLLSLFFSRKLIMICCWLLREFEETAMKMLKRKLEIMGCPRMASWLSILFPVKWLFSDFIFGWARIW